MISDVSDFGNLGLINRNVAASRCRRKDVFSDKKLGEFTTHVSPALLNCEDQV